jgi:uncharacterized phiE125 gp8 family phage protein
MPPRGNEDAVQYRSLTRQTAPAVEPVTLAEAKAHLRVDVSDDDAYIGTLITAAREWCEQYLDRTLVDTQWVMRFDAFPPDGTHDIELPRPPMVSSGTATAVALTFTYENGTTATYSTASYRVDRASTPGAVKTLYGQTWPPHLLDDNAISVTWWAGYGASGSSVPAAIRSAVLMLVGLFYEKRMAADAGSLAEVPFGVKSLLDAHRWGSYR